MLHPLTRSVGQDDEDLLDMDDEEENDEERDLDAEGEQVWSTASTYYACDAHLIHTHVPFAAVCKCVLCLSWQVSDASLGGRLPHLVKIQSFWGALEEPQPLLCGPPCPRRRTGEM